MGRPAREGGDGVVVQGWVNGRMCWLGLSGRFRASLVASRTKSERPSRHCKLTRSSDEADALGRRQGGGHGAWDKEADVSGHGLGEGFAGLGKRRKMLQVGDKEADEPGVG